jgi:plastocyanin
MTMMRIVECVIAAASALTMTACGGGDSTTSPTPNPGGSTGGATITITTNGVSPQNVTVVRGAQVTFVNNDNRPHEIRSDPHPSHGDCPEINQVGLVQPGNNRQTGNLMTVRNCGFHDHADASNTSLQGTIRIQ